MTTGRVVHDLVGRRPRAGGPIGQELHEDAAVESDTWELLKSELDRDRLSRRRLWT